MNKIRTSLVFGVAVASLSFAVVASADPEASGCPRHGNKTSLVERFDANRDGVLTKDEVPAHMAERFDKIDANHDGKVTVDELKAARPAKGERFARADKNGDGAITKDEVPERAWSFLSRADANGDGRVTKAELEAARAARK